jgi:hypothetical protein
MRSVGWYFETGTPQSEDRASAQALARSHQSWLAKTSSPSGTERDWVGIVICIPHEETLHWNRRFAERGEVHAL